MSYSGENVYEDNVPFATEVTDRIHGFFQEIGWTALEKEGGQMIVVLPDTGDLPVDGIGYWQTETAHKNEWFNRHLEPADGLSVYTKGLRLPRLMDLRERPLIVPDLENLLSIIGRGGQLLEQHTYIPLRKHASRSEIRFIDPFLFGIRIATPVTAEQP